MGYTDMEIESSSDYIKLTPGEAVTFHILSESPSKSVVHWVNRQRTGCTGKDCDVCAEGNKPKQRWTCEVWDRKEKRVKKFEFGASIAGQIRSIAEMLAENQQTVRDIDLRIKTTGSGLETEYSVLHVPVNGQIPTEIMEKFQVPF